MLYKDICKILSYYLFSFCIILILPLSVAFYYQFLESTAAHPQPHTFFAFLETLLICLGCAILLYFSSKKEPIQQLFRREGLAAVVLIWFITPAIASLPYLLSDTLESPLHAYFEASSGFTTTGATIMQAKKFDATGKEIPYEETICGVHSITYTYFGTIDPIRDPETKAVLYEGIEAVSKALLFWRSLTQWLGGVGIIVLFVAILPALGVGGKTALSSRSSRPFKRRPNTPY